MSDSVKHPAHYQMEGIPCESIDVIRAVLGNDGFKKFCRGNALKYLMRADKKGGAEDLKKARVYLDWEINDDHEAEQAETTEETSRVYAEEHKEEPDLIKAAGALKKHCETIIDGEELHCYDCIFHCEEFDTCELNGSLPCGWELPQEGDDEE